MRICLPLAFCLFGACLAGPLRAAETSPESADRALAASLLSGAERTDRAGALAGRGAALLEAGRYAEARRILREALDYAPDHARARELLEKAEQYLAAYGEIPGAAIEGAIRREKIGVEQRLIEARYLLRTAESALEEASAPVGGDLAERATALESRQRALSRAAEAAERAGLQLAGLPARIDTTTERETLLGLNRRIRDRRAQLIDAIDQAQRQIALRKVEEARVRVGETSERRRAFRLDKARSFLQDHEYEEAEEIVKQVLVEAPADSEAKQLLRRIQEEAIRYYREAEKTETAEERRRVQQRTRRASIPEITLRDRLVYPEDWEEIERRKEAAAAAGAFESEGDRQLREALGQRVSVEFDNDDVQNVLATLREQTSGVDFLYKEPIETFPEPVTLTLRNMRLDRVMDLVTRKANLAWTIRDGMVFVSGLEDLEEEEYTEVYNTQDLSTRVTDAPEMEDSAGLEGEDDDTEAANLGEVVQNVLAQEFLDGTASVSLNDRGWLTVYGTPDVHERVESLLTMLRSASQIQVAVNARLMRVANDFWTEFRSDFRPQKYGPVTDQEDVYGRPFLDDQTTPYDTIRLWPDDDNVPADRIVDTSIDHNQPQVIGSFLPSTMGASFINNAGGGAGLSVLLNQFGYLQGIHADWFIRAAKEKGKGDQLFAPHLVVYNNRLGWVRFTGTRHVIGDYSVQDDTLDPTVEAIEEVRALEVRPIVSADKKYITLHIAPKVSQILSVGQAQAEYFIPNPQTGQVIEFNLPIDLTNILEWEVATTATIPDGGSVVLSGLSVNVEARTRNGIPVVQDLPLIGNAFSRRANQSRIDDLMVLVSARMILLDEEEARQTR